MNTKTEVGARKGRKKAECKFPSQRRVFIPSLAHFGMHKSCILAVVWCPVTWTKGQPGLLLTEHILAADE